MSHLARLAAAAGLMLVVGEAHAYKCTAMPSNGGTVFWQTREVPFVINDRCSEDAQPAVCIEAVRRSFFAWNDVACSDFTFVDTGTTADARAGYDWRRPEANENVVVFREGHLDDPLDGWGHQRGALAITTVTFNSQNGKILDADIEVNGAPNGSREYKFQICDDNVPDGCVENDVQNTMTHEAGHVLGLDHPPPTEAGAGEATMFGSAPLGELIKRSLSPDDEAGLCAIYPPGAPVNPCVPAPVSGLPIIRFTQRRLCNDTGLDPCGSNCASSSGGGGAWLIVLVMLSRRRRRNA